MGLCVSMGDFVPKNPQCDANLLCSTPSRDLHRVKSKLLPNESTLDLEVRFHAEHVDVD